MSPKIDKRRGLGEPGLIGRAGFIGLNGDQGEDGFTGFKGNDGFLGAQGSPNSSFDVQNTLYVDGTYGNDSNLGTSLTPLLTIQAAVDAANVNDLIIVHRGSYSETITISQSLTIDFRASTINQLNISGSSTIVNIKGFPTITDELSDYLVNVESGATLIGKIKNITNTSADEDPYYGMIVTGSGSKAIVDFRDIRTNQICLNAESDGNIIFRCRDFFALYRDGRCIYVDNGDVTGYLRDAFNGEGPIVGGSIPTYAIQSLGTNPKLNLLARDIYEPLVGIAGGSLNLVNGSTHLFCRDLPQRGSRLREQVIITNASVNLKCRDITGRSNGFAVIECFQGAELSLIARQLSNFNEQNTNILELSGNGSRNIKIIAQKCLTQRGAFLESNTNSSGLSTVQLDSTIYQLIDSNNGAITNIIRDNCTGTFTGFQLKWNRFERWVFDFDNANQKFGIDLCCIFKNDNTSTNVGILTSDSQTDLDVYTRVHRIRGFADDIVDTTLSTSEPNTGLISLSGSGRLSFEIDQIENTDTRNNAGFVTYLYGDETLEAHFYNTVFNSPNLAIGLETETGASFADSARLFFHGSNTIIGETGTDFFTTDSTSIVTLDTASGNRAVVINEGRINSNTDFETSSAKGLEVVEPINGPEGAKSINSDYLIVHT